MGWGTGTYTSEDVTAAAKRMSSETPTTTYLERGQSDSQGAWTQLRGKIARAAISDPDIGLYFPFLSANKLRALAIAQASRLSRMIVHLEGRRLESKTPPDPSSELIGSLARIGSRVAYGDLLPEKEFDRLSSEYSRHAEEVGTTIRRSGKPSKIGKEADSALVVEYSRTIKDWERLTGLISYLSTPPIFPARTAQSAALGGPIQSLKKVVEVGPSSDASDASSYLLDLSAGVAAMEALRREVDITYRAREASPFPSWCEIRKTPEAGPASKLEFLRSGVAVNPVLLGIRAGDVVFSNGVQAATVARVDADSLRLSATINIGEVVDVLSASAVPWLEHPSRMRKVGSIPTRDALVSRVKLGTSRSEVGAVRDLCEYLAGIAASLDSVSTEAARSLYKLGGVLPAPSSTLSAELLTFSKESSFRRSTVASAKGILNSLRDSGLRRGEKGVVESGLSWLMGQKDVAGVSRHSALGRSMAELSRAVGEPSPRNSTVRRR